MLFHRKMFQPASARASYDCGFAKILCFRIVREIKLQNCILVLLFRSIIHWKSYNSRLLLITINLVPVVEN